MLFIRQPLGPNFETMQNQPENSTDELIRVLVVEDNVDDSDLLVRQLQKTTNFSGSIKVVPDGGEAWDLLGSEDACLDLIAIFLDLNLTTLSGVQLLRRIKAQPELCDIPVLIMTSSNNPAELDECTRLGVRGYVPKPVTYTAFSKAVADLFHLPSARTYSRVE
jgi:two-component system response regulator